MAKVLVIGLDGATWNLLTPWIHDGSLPTLKKLIENGLCDKLESSIPPVTYPAWKCYSTGKNPAKLDVYTWTGVNFKNKKMQVYDSKSFKSDDYWDDLSRNGYKVGIINMPGTYPPKPVNGFMISGTSADEFNQYTYPEDLKDYLIKKYDYKVHPSTMFSTDAKTTLDDSMDLIKIRFDVAKEYVNTVDLLHLTIFYIDNIQHYMWKYMKMGGEYEHAIKNAWKLIDSKMDELISCAGDKCNVILMSDHGFTEQVATFYMNTWLEKEGYLNRKRNNLKFLYSLGLNRDRLMKIIEKLKIKPILIRIIPQSIAFQIPDKVGKVGISGGANVLDWDKTKVIAIGEGPIYINKDNMTESEYKKLRKDLAENLKNIKDPENDVHIISNVYLKEEIYKGKYLDNAPDIVVMWNEGYEIRGYLTLDGKMWDYDYEWSAHHKRHGIFVAHGPDIRNDVEIKGTTIYDLAPSILHMFGVPISKELDGTVLTKIFRDDSEFAKRKIRYEIENKEVHSMKSRIGTLKKSGKI